MRNSLLSRPFCLSENCPSQIGTLEVALPDIRTVKLGGFQIGIRKVARIRRCVIELDTRHLGILEISLVNTVAAKVGAGQVGLLEGGSRHTRFCF